MDAEDPPAIKPELELDLINSAEILGATLALKIIISDLAVSNRNPDEASKYVDRFRRQMESFINSIDDRDNPINRIVKERMVEYTDKLLTGIKFERVKR